MKAVIKTGGKQYLVSEGDVLDIEKTPTESGKVVFNEVLLLTEEDGKNIQIGDPLLKGAKVEAEVVDEHKAGKVVVFKMRRRKNYRRKTGHRQQVLRIKVAKISA
ncbi:MAG: 50S ribosomal protein L21 [Patescibacteria group bacterium]